MKNKEIKKRIDDLDNEIYNLYKHCDIECTEFSCDCQNCDCFLQTQSKQKELEDLENKIKEE